MTLTRRFVLAIAILATMKGPVSAQSEAVSLRAPTTSPAGGGRGIAIYYNHLLDPVGHGATPERLAALRAGVPGFGLRENGEWINDLFARNPREMTAASDGVLQEIHDWEFEYFTPMRGAGKNQVVSVFAKSLAKAAEQCATWGNAFVAESSTTSGLTLKKVPQRAALAGLEGQPFVFLHRRLGYDSAPVLKDASCDLAAGGSIQLRFDPQYTTLIRLSLSGVQSGWHEYPLSLLTPDGKPLYQGRARLEGVEPARLRVRIVDGQTQNPVEALMALRSPAGRECPPNAPPYYIKNFRAMWRPYDRAPWPIDDSKVNITKGEFEMPVFPGQCRLIVGKGPEYLCQDESFEARAGALTEKTIALQRFIDLPPKNWISGDDHCHIDRTYERDSDIMDLLAAVGLNMTNILQAGDDAKLIFMQDRWGELSQLWRGQHMMVTGQEDPRTPWRGHALIFNTQNSIHDRTSYYVYEDAFKEARKQGGMTGYAHSAKDFQAELGATVSIPLNLVDFIELDSADSLHRDVIYHFWDLGFPIVAASGSDFPWGPLPGFQRFYTHVDGELTYDKYMMAFKAGRTFVSRGGAFLDIRANGELPGSVIRARAGEALKLAIRADLNPQYDKLDRVEIVRNGVVIETLRPAKAGDTFIEREIAVKPDASAWLAGRLFGAGVVKVKAAPDGAHPSCAHTNPFWLEVDGKPFLNRAALTPALARANGSLDKLVQLMDAAAPPINPQLLRAQRPRLDAYIREARDAYARIGEKASKGK